MRAFVLHGEVEADLQHVCIFVIDDDSTPDKGLTGLLSIHSVLVSLVA